MDPRADLFSLFEFSNEIQSLLLQQEALLFVLKVQVAPQVLVFIFVDTTTLLFFYTAQKLD